MNLATIERAFKWQDFIEAHKNDWSEIARCGNLKPSFINMYVDKLDIDLVAQHQTLKMATIDRYFDRISEYTFACNIFVAIPNFRTEILEKHLDSITGYMWRSIAVNLELNLKFVKKYQDKLMPYIDQMKRNERLHPDIRKYYKLNRW